MPRPYQLMVSVVVVVSTSALQTPKTLLVLLFDQNRFVTGLVSSTREIDLNDLSLWPRSPQAAAPRHYRLPPLLLTSKSVFQPPPPKPLLFPLFSGVPLREFLCGGSPRAQLALCVPVWSVPIDRGCSSPPGSPGRGMGMARSFATPACLPLAPPSPSTTRGSANGQLECGWIQKRTRRDLYSQTRCVHRRRKGVSCFV